MAVNRSFSVLNYSMDMFYNWHIAANVLAKYIYFLSLFLFSLDVEISFSKCCICIQWSNKIKQSNIFYCCQAVCVYLVTKKAQCVRSWAENRPCDNHHFIFTAKTITSKREAVIYSLSFYTFYVAEQGSASCYSFFLCY